MKMKMNWIKILIVILMFTSICCISHADADGTADQIGMELKFPEDGVHIRNQSYILVLVTNATKPMTGVAGRIKIDIMRPDDSYLKMGVHPVEIMPGCYRLNFLSRAEGEHIIVVNYTYLNVTVLEMGIMTLKEREYNYFSRLAERLGDNIYIEQIDESLPTDYIVNVIKEQNKKFAELYVIVDKSNDQLDLGDIATTSVFRTVITLLAVLFFSSILMYAYKSKKQKATQRRANVKYAKSVID